MNFSSVNYYQRKLLGDNDIINIKNLIKNCEWESGLLTTFNITEETKKNLQVKKSIFLNQINSIIMNCLDFDNGFSNFCFPKQSKSVVVSKINIGGYYHPHCDDAKLGHFSTTVFISDPNEYEGGELCLYIDNKEEKFKLKPGFAVTYKTGILHRVNEVFSGERIVCLTWTTSAVKDSNTRLICSKINTALNIVRDKYPKSVKKNFDEILNDPVFILEDVIEDLIRLQN